MTLGVPLVGPPGSLQIVNARIRDPASEQPLGDSLVVRNGTIVGVGTASETAGLSEDQTVLDAEQGTVLPAFTDSHTHFKRASVYKALYIDFDAVGPRSISQVVESVRDRAKSTDVGGWIQGDSLDPSRLKECRFPNRWELDNASSKHPIVLRSVGRHVVAANSLALSSAGIDSRTDDPPGGFIERDYKGEPLGVLHEEAKLRLDADRSDTVIPAPSKSDRLAALARGVKLLNSFGITTIHEIPRTSEQIGDWLALREIEAPTVRVRLYVRGVGAQTKLEYLTGLGLRTGFGDEWIRLAGMKVSIDGSVSNRKAMVYEPYPGTTDTGLERVGRDELIDSFRTAHDASLQIAVHAIGQRAVDQALDAFEVLQREGRNVAELRHRIEHACLPPAEGQLDRISELGVVLSMQPAFIESSGDSWVSVFQDRVLPGVMPIASALRLGIPVILNSDYPNASLNPFVGIKAAVQRTTSAGVELDASESISIRTALKLMTHTPPLVTFEDTVRGRIDVGQQADLIVVDRDPFELHPDELEQVGVSHTIVGGRLGFSRSAV